MSLLAKSVIKNKFWVLENDGKQVGTIQVSPLGVTLVSKGKREKFPSLKILSDRYNIVVDQSSKKTSKQVKEQSPDVYGYPCAYKAYNILWDVPKKLPVFTKGRKSKSFFCAGYYAVKFNNGWVKSFCPKLITLNRYDYRGPYKTLETLQEQLRLANGEFNGSKSTS